MSKKIIFALIILAVAAVVFWYLTDKQVKVTPAPDAEKQAVLAAVAEFGKRLQAVSLLAPDASEQIRRQYGDLISADLLAAWQKEPIKAPGRLTSSPWPDHIEVLGVDRQADGAYEVYGKVIEITSTQVVSGGVAAQYAISMKLRNPNGKWIITGFVKAVPQ